MRASRIYDMPPTILESPEHAAHIYNSVIAFGRR